MAMRASCSFLSSRDAFKCQGGCASCDLLHYFCCYPCTGSSCVQKSCLQQVSIQTLPVLRGAEPHSCHQPQGTRGHPGTSPQHFPGSLGWAPFISAMGNQSSRTPKRCQLTPSSSAAELSILLLILLLGLRGCLAASDCTVRALINDQPANFHQRASLPLLQWCSDREDQGTAAIPRKRGWRGWHFPSRAGGSPSSSTADFTFQRDSGGAGGIGKINENLFGGIKECGFIYSTGWS